MINKGHTYLDLLYCVVIVFAIGFTVNIVIHWIKFYVLKDYLILKDETHKQGVYFNKFTSG